MSYNNYVGPTPRQDCKHCKGMAWFPTYRLGDDGMALSDVVVFGCPCSTRWHNSDVVRMWDDKYLKWFEPCG